MAGAAGSFIARSFESMLKECAGKKYGDLQKAIQTYLDNANSLNSKKNEAGPLGENKSTVEGSSEIAKGEFASDAPTSISEKAEGVDQAGKTVPSQGSISAALSNAGHLLEGAELELVLRPLKLAFETKNARLVDLALDCLHKIIAYDHLEGDPGLDGGKNAAVLADILNMVCSCVDNSSLDSTILQVLKVLLTAVASTKYRVHGELLLGVIRICYNIALNSKSQINQATSKAMLTQMISIVFRRMETDKAPRTSYDGSAASADSTSAESSSSHNEEVSFAEKDESEISSSNTLPVNQAKDTSLASVEELQNLAVGADIKGLEAVLDNAVHLDNGKKISRGIDLESLSIGHRDALLVFRTLCKMGMKDDSDEVTTKTRLLSLELLQSLLEGVSHSFTKNFHFIDSVKAYLSYALLRASVSPSPAVFQYAAGIFAVLLLRFRESLKGEIGIFFPLVILRSLDSTDFPFNQRMSVLRMLEKVCKNPQMLVDVFVNYDCDIEAPNLFERMVHALSKIAQGTVTADPNSVVSSQMASVKGSSLQSLVNVLKSLVEWEKSHRGANKLDAGVESVGLKEGAMGDEELKNKVDVPNRFEKAKAHKSTMETAVSEFNRNPTKGLQYLISNMLVEKNPASVAQFLKNTPNLDKAMIGDYLGQHEEFPVAAMHAYVDSMNFSGLKFDMAIREFLKGFRLPGEAQKIDRIMEKFAERFCADNPELFKNADTAYVLAYAVIMLNTDAHNPTITTKMSKVDFVRMNTSNDAEECVPKELLEEIYDSIVKEEIKLKNDIDDSKQRAEAEERSTLVSILNLAIPRKRSAAEVKTESEAIIKRTQAIFKSQDGKRGIFYTAHEEELVRPMLEAVGWPLLATFSVTMEEGDNKPRVSMCMEGFRSGIHITRVLGMDTMRYAFLTSLVRLTFLHAPKELRSKNVEALRTLLGLCDLETDCLQDTWNAVLECVSRLEYITSTPFISATVMQGSNQISRDAVLQSLKELAGKPAEQVFVNSVKLPSDSIVELFTALCGVSAEELKQTPARVFSLQKLVEISYYNMARIRLVWARIWSILANHFISAGSHHDEKIAMYAIDSLRQLGMKYLERAELANFTFQNDILKPFVVLIRSTRSERVRGLIVDCIVQMIKSKVGSIKSGWRSVFMIFTAAADDDLEPTVESAFENVEQVILEHFDQVVGDCFMDCVNCLIGFANNKSSHRISLKAIALLRICEDRLAEGLIPGGALRPVDNDVDSNFDVTEHYWFPMLAGLSDLTLDYRSEVRNCALEVLFDLLNERGQKFSSVFWESIFHRVLFPIFDHVRHAGNDGFVSSDDEWLRETSIHSLQLLCNLFNTFYQEVSFMLPSLLGLLLDCAKKSDQTVVSIALGALVHLVEVGGHQFNDHDWDTLLSSIRDATYTTQPLELLNSLGLDNSSSHSSVSNHFANNLPKELNGLDLVNSTGGISPRTKSESPRKSSSPTFSQNLSSNGALQMDSKNSEGRSLPKPADAENLQRSQTLGQRLMGNMMDNLLLRSLTSKSKKHQVDALGPSSPIKVPDAVEPDYEEEEESPILETIRGKCVTQLLLLGAVDNIQRKYWSKLKPQQKITIMEILLPVLDFAGCYNSYSNLRLRMHHISAERPPMNLLRQELAGTTIYLDVLHKMTSTCNMPSEEHSSISNGYCSGNNDVGQVEVTEEKLIGIAEEKLVTFCGQILKDASDLQPSSGEAATMDIHKILEIRSPVIVKVLKGMCLMNNNIFRRHLNEFYPLITKLVCCDQMDIRGALGDLFTTQLTALLP